MTTNQLFMSELEPGMSAEVVAFQKADSMCRRLQDLGLVEGTRVTCLGRSLWGDPAAYRICGAIIALRREDCAQILLRVNAE